MSLKVYAHYCRAGGLSLCFATMIFNALYQACAVGTNLWLTQWSADHEKAFAENKTMTSQSRDIYLGVYGVFGFGQGTFVQCCQDQLIIFLVNIAPNHVFVFIKSSVNFVHI